MSVSIDARTTPAGGCWAADQSLTEIYSAEYDSLVRMAASLVSDIQTAEDVVQDSIVAMHGAWPNLYDNDKALAYLRQSVMNRARSVIRRRMVVDRHPPKPEPNAPSAEYTALTELERSTVVSALRLLPERQREVLVLRFYLGLREGQIAATMGITRGTVKVHIRRAMTAMRDVLGPGGMARTAREPQGGDGRVSTGAAARAAASTLTTSVAGQHEHVRTNWMQDM